MIDVRAREGSGARNGFRFMMRAVSILLTVLFIASCGNDIFLVGTPVITLTAQRGHFLSYIVTIDEIEMTRKDGTVIELPTVSERVDLANLGNFTQLLETPAVGIGTYVSATFFIDYTSAYITVDDNGQAAQTTLTDGSTGTTPGVDSITVTFDPNNPLVITNQNASTVNFNIDLEASNTIGYYGATSLPLAVTTHPIFTVSATPVYTQPVFARGLFVYVDSKNGTFTLNTRPLHDVLDNPFGALTVQPNDQTYWNINGVPYQGAAGLAALSKLQSETAELQIAAVGLGNAPFNNLTGPTPAFDAAQVYVGSSLESTIQDHIVGFVSAISGDTLTVQNAALVDRLGDYGFQNTIPVTVGPSTIVSIDGVMPATTPGLTNISVGQLIDVSGVTSVDSLFNPTALDATAGQVRLQQTSLWGTLNSATPGSADINLQWIQNLEVEPNPANVNFAGTGTSSGEDASASSYIINTGTTDESAVAAGTLFNIVGLPTAYGSGPPYFTATSTTPASSLPQQLIIEYSGTGSPQPFSDIAASAIYINLNDPALVNTVHVIQSGPVVTTNLAVDQPTQGFLVLIPATSTPQTTNLFTIGNTTNGQGVFSDPGEFVARIQYDTGAVGSIQKIVATGQYDPVAGTFTATNIEMVVQH
jgi:hypothetical protein